MNVLVKRPCRMFKLPLPNVNTIYIGSIKYGITITSKWYKNTAASDLAISYLPSSVELVMCLRVLVFP